MPIDRNNDDSAGRGVFGLKWKAFVAVAGVLAVINVALALVLYEQDRAEFEAERAAQRLVHGRNLDVALSAGVDSATMLAALLARGSDLPTGQDRRQADTAALLRRFAGALTARPGFVAVHYLAPEGSSGTAISWPAGRDRPVVPAVDRQGDAPIVRLACAADCLQLISVAVPFEDRPAGRLIVERKITESLGLFHRLSDADAVLLRPSPSATVEHRALLTPWRQSIAFTHTGSPSLTALRAAAARVDLRTLGRTPERLQSEGEWYEISVASNAAVPAGLTLLLVERISDQIARIREAAVHSLTVGIGGLLLSISALLAVMWGPMRRIQQIVSALPLLADKSYGRLREELPAPPTGGGLEDEIDAMVEMITRVAGQIEALDEARSIAEDALRDRERSLQLAQSMARVASWKGQPQSGAFEIRGGGDEVADVFADITTWADFLRLIHPEDRGAVQNSWRAARAGGKMDLECRLNTRTGQIDVHMVGRFVVASDGRTLCADGMLQDVTEIRAFQRALRASHESLEEQVRQRTAELVAARREAEQIAASKTAFLAKMSHEIRTPLSAVLGLSEVGMRQSQNRRIAKTFEEILDAGEHLLNVVNDVLDLTKIEAGKLAIDCLPFELTKVVEQSAAMLRQRAEEKGLRMRLHLAEDLPAWVEGDAFRVQQILLNLLSNAVKFTERGTISLEVTNAGPHVAFTVTDTGPGMSREQVQRLFMPFPQLEASTAEQREGTGLGLSISNSLAALMGGEIRVQSRPGSGSVFQLRIPLRASKPGPSAGESHGEVRVGPPRRLAGVRVLVADDVQINRKILAALLRAEGAEVTVVCDGAEVLSRIRDLADDGPDILFMDLEMPNMDGRQAARALRESGNRVPIIGVTAHASAEARDAAFAAGMSDLLIKPILQGRLVDVVLAHVRRRPGDDAPAGEVVR